MFNNSIRFSELANAFFEYVKTKNNKDSTEFTKNSFLENLDGDLISGICRILSIFISSSNGGIEKEFKLAQSYYESMIENGNFPLDFSIHFNKLDNNCLKKILKKLGKLRTWVPGSYHYSLTFYLKIC